MSSLVMVDLNSLFDKNKLMPVAVNMLSKLAAKKNDLKLEFVYFDWRGLLYYPYYKFLLWQNNLPSGRLELKKLPLQSNDMYRLNLFEKEKPDIVGVLSNDTLALNNADFFNLPAYRVGNDQNSWFNAHNLIALEAQSRL